MYCNLENLRNTSSKELGLLILELEYRAKYPFLKPDKRGEIGLTTDYTKWRSVENMAQAADSFLPGFFDWWQTHEKTLPSMSQELVLLEMFYSLFYKLKEK